MSELHEFVDWEYQTFSEITTIRPKKSQVRDKGDIDVSFVPMATVSENKKYFVAEEERNLVDVYKGYTYFENDDILLAKVTPCFENGKLAIAQNLCNGIGFGSSEFHVIRPNRDAVLSEWIYYFLHRDSFKSEGVAAMTGSSGLKRVPHAFLENTTIPVPSITEQKRIIKKLDELFEKIDSAIELAQQNLNDVDALFASILDKTFQIDEDLPDGWVLKKLDEVADIKGGKRLPKGANLSVEETDFPYIRVADFMDSGTVNLSTLRYITEDIASKIKRYTISSNDLYISIAGTIGKSGIIPNEISGANLTENAAKLVYIDDGILNKYVYYYTLSSSFNRQVRASTKTVAQPKLALKRLREFQIPISSITEQKRIVKKLDELFEICENKKQVYQSELTDLQKLKSSLLDKAFRGEL